MGCRDEFTIILSLEQLPDAERYETYAYGVYRALPVNKHMVGKYGAVNRTKSCNLMLRGKLNRLGRRTMGCVKSIEMPANPLTLVFFDNLKLNATQH